MGRLTKFFLDFILIILCFAILNHYIDVSFLNLPYTSVPINELIGKNVLFYILIGIMIADVLFNGLFGLNTILLIILSLTLRNWLLAFLIVVVFRILRSFS